MKEVNFLRENAPKWRSLEALLEAPGSVDPDQLAKYFLEITDDLSYSRTFYPDSKTTRYLNDLAGRVHQLIYKNSRESRSRILTFWTTELPEIFLSCRPQLLISLLFFAVAVAIGVVSALNDNLFVRMVLGDGYVNMTLQNIKSQDPMAVYKQMHQHDMFLRITFNNIMVSLRVFAAGILLSFGTLYVLFTNGVMLGSFQTFFYQHDLLWTSMLTIWIHGTLEISAIIIAGCAGLVLGNSILFPGTFSRRASLMIGARRGLKIVIGLVPIFIFAGFLESYVTRHTDMPVWLSLTIILGSLGFIIWYVLLYPVLRRRRAGE